MSRIAVATWTLFLLSLALFGQAPSDSGQAPNRLAGHWEGAIELPNGALEVKVDLAQSPDGWSGTIDIPAQGASGLALVDIEVEGSRARFTIGGVPGTPTFDGNLIDGDFAGSFTQGGGRLSFRLGREKLAEPARPQTPQPPFPYTEEEVSYENGSIRLAATLTTPAGPGPFPAVVLLTGSGPQNRDEELMGHKPFWVLADHLARNGIAVLRADDRGVGGSSGNTVDVTTEDFALDALAGVEFLRARSEVRQEAIGLVGHSEGGTAASLAAAKSKSVNFLVLLAAPGVSGAKILPHQSRLIAAANSAPPALVEAQIEILEKGLEKFDQDLSDGELRAALLDMVRRQLETGGGGGEAFADAELEAVLSRQVDSMLSPWFRYFLTHDPAGPLRNVKVPVLALNGELDLQVDPTQNLPAIEGALSTASNEDVTAERLPGLNHLFQTATTGAPAEYHQIEETFSPIALEKISGWIRERYPPAER